MTAMPQGWAKRVGTQKTFKRKLQKYIFFCLNIVKMFSICIFKVVDLYYYQWEGKYKGLKLRCLLFHTFLYAGIIIHNTIVYAGLQNWQSKCDL